MYKKILSFMLSVCLIFSVFLSLDAVSVDVSAADTTTNGLAADVQDGQILQCWNWSFNNIKANIPKIAEQGFSAIQTSPIQATKESTKETWSTASNAFWVYYQPINFSIETNSRSALGTKAEFKAMCDEAHKYGVKVIVDTVFNHLANGTSDNTLNSQTPSDIRNDSSCWHTVTNNISNYSDRYDVTHNCLAGLPDLNTGNAKVQNYAISFLKECIDAGADGFRFDAAKHIETPSDYSGTSSDFWPNVLNAATSHAQSSRGITPYYYGEILDSACVDISAYTKYMSVTDNSGSNSIRNAVNSANAGSAANSAIFNGAQPKYTVQWNESHDTYAEGSSNYVSDTNLKKTWALVGSRSEVCGLYLARPNNGSTKLGAADKTAWADKEVKEINKFKNNFIGQSEYFASSGNIAYVERGTSGVILVNVSGTNASVNVTANRIASGTYTDAISGNTFNVSNGKISGNIGSTGIAVVYNKTDSGEIETIAPTEPSTSVPISGETITVKIGVIEYIKDTQTVHYWNDNGVFGDAVLIPTDETVSYSVGSSYWSDAKKNFNVYTADIPVEATKMKTYFSSTNSNWAQEEVECNKDKLTLVFEWGGIYHNTSVDYITENPTVEPTVTPTEEVTETPTELPTEEVSETQTEVVGVEPGYYLVGTLNGVDCWSASDLSDNKKFNLVNESSKLYKLDWEFANGDELKVVYFDGSSITHWYNSSGSNYKIGSSKAGKCTISFCPDGNSAWSYHYFTVQPLSEVETDAPTQTESSTEALSQDNEIKVKNIVTNVGSTTIKFNWDSVDNATKYWIYKYDDSNKAWTSVASCTGTSVVIRKLEGGTSYKFKIIALIKNAGALKLEDADEVEVTTKAPVVVNNVKIISNVTSADISWDAVDGASKYWIYKSTNPNGPFYVYNSSTTTDCTAKRLRPDSTYYFKIVAMTVENNITCFSNLDDATLASVNTGSASIITTKADSNTATSATISWPAFENADKYWVMYSTTSADTTDRSHWTTYTSTTDTTYTFKNLKPNTVYYLNVCARYSDSNGVYTIDYIPIMLRTAYSNDNFITFTPVDDTNVTLSWDENIENVEKTWVCAIDADGKEIGINSTTSNTVTIRFSNYKNYSYALKVVDNSGRIGYITKTGGEKYHE